MRCGIPISDNWSFFSIGVLAETLREKIDWKSAFLKERSVWPKILGTMGCPHKPFLLSESQMNGPFTQLKNFGSRPEKCSCNTVTQRHKHKRPACLMLSMPGAAEAQKLSNNLWWMVDGQTFTLSNKIPVVDFFSRFAIYFVYGSSPKMLTSLVSALWPFLSHFDLLLIAYFRFLLCCLYLF